MADWPQPPPPIKHRSLENQYTKYVSYIAQCIYTHGRLTPPPGQLSIDALNTTAPNLGDLPHPPSIEHRMLWIPLHHTWQIYWQTYPPQSSIDALNTATPNLADLMADLPPIKHRCLEYHYTKIGRSTPQSIEHRCLEYCYTKLGRSNCRSTRQLSIDVLNTATPNLADLIADLPANWA